MQPDGDRRKDKKGVRQGCLITNGRMRLCAHVCFGVGDMFMCVRVSASLFAGILKKCFSGRSLKYFHYGQSQRKNA